MAWKFDVNVIPHILIEVGGILHIRNGVNLHLQWGQKSTNLQQQNGDFLHSTTKKWAKSTSTMTLIFYKSTTSKWLFSTFYNKKRGKIYNLHLPYAPPNMKKRLFSP